MSHLSASPQSTMLYATDWKPQVLRVCSPDCIRPHQSPSQTPQLLKRLSYFPPNCFKSELRRVVPFDSPRRVQVICQWPRPGSIENGQAVRLQPGRSPVEHKSHLAEIGRSA